MIRVCSLLVLLCALASPARAGLDLDAWDSLLGAAVNRGQVDYAMWAANPAFDALVEQIATTRTADMDVRQKLVFYINAYNILAARGILDGHSPDSLLGRYVYFKLDKYTVAGEQVSLYALEHELLLPLKEPRVHFAIVCASQSCPLLRSSAYRLASLDEQLDQAAREFVNDPHRNQFDLARREARLSSIFKWFDEDFIAAAGSVQSYVARFAEDREVATRLRAGDFAVTYLPYDWSLNGTL
ncbi:MAG: DUF547 domain-containing protein [Halioglobus sp.]